MSCLEIHIAKNVKIHIANQVKIWLKNSVSKKRLNHSRVLSNIPEKLFEVLND